MWTECRVSVELRTLVFLLLQIVKVFARGFCQSPPPGCPRGVYLLMVECWYERGMHVTMRTQCDSEKMNGTHTPLYNGYHWDPAAGCPVKRGAPNSEVDLYTALNIWDATVGQKRRTIAP